ncbi:MAG: hypothetical protein AABZ00_03870 [Chloroflexota bacterium]
MILSTEGIKIHDKGLGIGIKFSNPYKQLWSLSDIRIHKEISYQETGMVIFIARDQMGLPVGNIEFVVAWQNIIAYPDQDYTGRYSMKLDHVYDPAIEHGQYWGGFLEDGIAPEVIGFGIPKGYKIEIKIVYTQLEGGA